ncbi:hypothetical protein CROQUDRAFT_98671 [Cronartium quercuum f. sp. fusiforme G11]|uniref:Uncharacterized protein n=1 Tax=Cronartium quercuum f. sp. fusiforme G11 TaxID=708437 RepID=A0A9P6N7X4_9BASI|nr:hypothetical protein CROQUDRAFT_98671 [Cronartium quercuum f. sp. fusiforme G11]
MHRRQVDDDLTPLVIPAEKEQPPEDVIDDSVHELEQQDDRVPSRDVDREGMEDNQEEEEFDKQIELEITPPTETLRQSTHKCNKPQCFIPGSNNLIDLKMHQLWEADGTSR